MSVSLKNEQYYQKCCVVLGVELNADKTMLNYLYINQCCIIKFLWDGGFNVI